MPTSSGRVTLLFAPFRTCRHTTFLSVRQPPQLPARLLARRRARYACRRAPIAHNILSRQWRGSIPSCWLGGCGNGQGRRKPPATPQSNHFERDLELSSTAFVELALWKSLLKLLKSRRVNRVCVVENTLQMQRPDCGDIIIPKGLSVSHVHGNDRMLWTSKLPHTTMTEGGLGNNSQVGRSHRTRFHRMGQPHT